MLKEHSKKLELILGRAYIFMLCVTPFLWTFLVELLTNKDPQTLRVLPMVIEVIVCILIEIVLAGVLPFYSIGLCIGSLLALLFGMANFYLLRFRDIPLMFMDIPEVATALKVAKGYDFTPEPNVIIAIIITIIWMAGLIVLYPFFKKMTVPPLRYLHFLSAGLFSTAGLIILIGFVGFSGTFGIVMNMWKPGLTYSENGAISSFIAYAQFSDISQPKGYSVEEVARILQEAEKEYDKTHKSMESDLKPTVISIMDEAFSDLSVLGPLEGNESTLSFYRSLKKDPGTIWHGYTYVSTYAGGTARSEFEYLTGYSMIPYANAQPYSQFDFSDIKTSVSDYRDEGYTAYAMHPEAKTNYRRNTVYSGMGFDKFYSIDDYKGYDRVDYMDDYRISDSGDFKKITDIVDESDGPVFIHNVTMQNHGGYDYYLPVEERVEVDENYRNYSEFVKYQTLLKSTDNAIEELINHYRNSDKPVIICLYGDHLPNMPEDLMADLMTKGYDSTKSKVANEQRRYKIPFFVWANYDLKDHVKGYAIDGQLSTSMNYLGAVVKADAGLKLNAFDKYLLLLREKLPVINGYGYVAGGQWHDAKEETEYSQAVHEYEIVQYGLMFDKESLMYLFEGGNDG